MLCLAVLLGLGALTWRQSGMYADNETLWRTTLARNPDSFMAHNNLAEILYKKGHLDDAIAELQKAVTLKPDAAKAHYNLGSFLLRQGHTDEAIAEEQKALAIAPHDLNAIDCLGSAYFQKGETEMAIGVFGEASRTRPEAAEPHVRLAGVYVKTGRMDEAGEELEKAVHLEPDNPDALRASGEFLLQADQPDEAIVFLKRSAALAPDPVTLGLLGNALLQKNRVDEAAAVLAQAVSLRPDDSFVRHNLGAALLQKGDVAGAIQQFEISLKLGLNAPDAVNDLAWLLATCPDATLRNGRLALQLATQTVQATGGREPMCLATLAAAQAELGQFSNAVETVQSALRAAGKDSDPSLTADLGGQLEIYRAGKPYREDPRNPGAVAPGKP